MHWMQTSPPRQCRNFLRKMDELKLRDTIANEIGWCARPKVRRPTGPGEPCYNTGRSFGKFSQTSAIAQVAMAVCDGRYSHVCDSHYFQSWWNIDSKRTFFSDV